MQITNSFANGGHPPSQGGASELASQLQHQRKQQRRILFLRTLGFWWPRVLLVGVTAALAVFIAQTYAQDYLLYIAIIAAVAIFLFILARHAEVGLFITAMISTAFFLKGISIKSLNLYPAIPLFCFLFAVVAIQTALRLRKPVLPSFWAIWPGWGLVVMAIISSLLVQTHWTPTVPHKVVNSPIIYDELLGVGLFFVPLVLITLTTIALTKRDQWINYIQRIILFLSVIAAIVVIIDFKRIGGDISQFRFSEPTIAWMPLRALATLMALGCIISYARLLYAKYWRMRLFYLVILALSLLGVYFSLENSWWLEVAVALAVMTIAYSRRFLVMVVVTLLVVCSAGFPLIYAEYVKLAKVKSVDSLRLIIWQDALRVWSKQPIFGVGPGNFWAYDQRFTGLPILLRNFQKTGLGVAHNGYLQALGELGPVGLIFLLAFIIVILVVSVRLYQRSAIPQKRANAFVRLIGMGLADDLVPYEQKRSAATRKLSTPIVTMWRFIVLIALGMTDTSLPADPEQSKGKPKRGWAWWKIALADRGSEKRDNRILGLLAIGLICGAAVADFTSGFFFLPPRQLGGANDLSQVVIPWIIWGCVMYKDQIWRMLSRGQSLKDFK